MFHFRVREHSITFPKRDRVFYCRVFENISARDTSSLLNFCFIKGSPRKRSTSNLTHSHDHQIIFSHFHLILTAIYFSNWILTDLFRVSKISRSHWTKVWQWLNQLHCSLTNHFIFMFSQRKIWRHFLKVRFSMRRGDSFLKSVVKWGSWKTRSLKVWSWKVPV